MPKTVLYIIYLLMVAIGLIAMYTIFNAGNPDSLLRPYLPDPSQDVYVAVISSFLVFILGFVVFYQRDRQDFIQILEMNAEKIRSQRRQGISDQAIADAILTAIGTRFGYRRNMALKKLVAYLAAFK
jgi:hypothetical protein